VANLIILISKMAKHPFKKLPFCFVLVVFFFISEFFCQVTKIHQEKTR
jgi:hypothetical protein